MALDTIGLISGLLGIAQFTETLFPTQVAEGTSVTIKAGLGNDHSSELGGGTSAVYAFDANNDYLGVTDGGAKMDAGGTITLTVNQEQPDRRGDYISFLNTNDATCISWVSVTMHDGTPGGSWTGDISRYCNQAWYYGNQEAGTNPDGTAFVPACGWFDGDDTNGYNNKGFKFTVAAYGNSGAQSTLDNEQGCSATIFSTTTTGPIDGLPAGDNGDISTQKRSSTANAGGIQTLQKRNASARSTRVRPAKFENHLIVSKKPQHSAEDLCNDPNSLGPDFVGSDGNFCNMAAKVLAPLCSKATMDGCVHINGTTLARRSNVAKRTVGFVQKTYQGVIHWD